MLCEGDSVGVFQVESRAQMTMLPRLRPRRFYDLVIEVAIVRPGPIQGDMVHPFLRRRQGKESVSYPSPDPKHGPADELSSILSRTLGVPLFQEQAMQIAIDAAKFTPDEANGLRKAMATFRKNGTIDNYEQRMVTRMVARGYAPEFAQNCFNQVKGFGDYGFPESHAASFALLVYVSSWLKCHHPEVFCAGLLNSQPMGFYAPAQIVRDAREHGVEVREVDVNLSHWDNTLEPVSSGTGHAVRLGFRQIDGLRQGEMQRLLDVRASGFAGPEQVRRLARLPRRTMEQLAAADAFTSLRLDRRDALWSVRGEAPGQTLPLFAARKTAEQGDSPNVTLPLMPMSEQVLQDYQTMRLSLKQHPLAFLRQKYAARGLLTTHRANHRPTDRKVQTAGLVLVRQRPATASGVVFITLEDETGVANLVVWGSVFKRYRAVLMGARILMVRGQVQTADNVTHIVAEHLEDWSDDLCLLQEAGETELAPPAPRAGHPRNVRLIPKSRDFH
jgi:error-prone DNA polymerase